MSRACHIPCWITNKNSNCAQHNKYTYQQERLHLECGRSPFRALCCDPFSLFFLFLILFIIYFIRFSSMPSYWCVLDKINFMHTNTTPIILSPLLEFIRNAIALGAVFLSIFSLFFASNRIVISFYSKRVVTLPLCG